jgi:hypothetical protein
MEFILLSLSAWFILGAISALWIYYDLKKTEISWPWVLVGFLLSVPGLALYLFMGKKKEPFIYPPAPNYDKPEYKFEGEKEEPPAAPDPAVESKLHMPEREVEQIEGIPRCSECGAAISKHDMKCPGCGLVLYPQ